MIAALPDKAKFVLQINSHNTRYTGITEEFAKLTGRKKLKARQDFPEKFTDNVGPTFPGLDKLPDRIRNGTIELSGSDIQSRGKAMGIPLGDNWWINVQLALHGHFIVIDSEELERDGESKTIQLALVNQDSSQSSIIIIDHNRLTTLRFVQTGSIFGSTSRWWSSKQGPCPIMDPRAFAQNFDRFKLSPKSSQSSIFHILTNRQEDFNGIGTSHANEILHLALEHPAQTASVIFGDKNRRRVLKEAIVEFFAFAHSPKYQRSIPAGKSGGSAFSEPGYLTRNIISLQQKVYGHTKGPTKITKDHYGKLLERGLLEDRYLPLGTQDGGRASRDSLCQSKKVNVFAFRFLNESDNDKEKKGYAYTVMCRPPPDCVSVRYVPPNKARQLALGSRAAEIGIAGFMDNSESRNFEREAVKRRFPVKEGNSGRPRKVKRCKLRADIEAPNQLPDRIEAESSQEASKAQYQGGPAESTRGGL